ncbi:hypothetical protein ABF176_002596, partial [Flavobacterium psychrophilum]
YWFTFENYEYKKLFEIFKNFKYKNPNERLPAIYKTRLETNILYLGKSKNCLWGRLITHLGYHQNRGYQGLMLSKWTKELNLKLTFNYCEFDPKMDEIISLYELKLSQQLKPLIGKHK